jgi:hypothetical protein
MKTRRQMLGQILSPSVARAVAVLCTAVFVAGAPSSAWAAGVVGTGSAASCTDAALNAALAGGGRVTFSCGADPVTIDISTGTGTKSITADTTIDGGGLITISGGHAVGVFSVNSGVNFTVNNLTIGNGYRLNDVGGGISNGGTLTVANSTFTGNGVDSPSGFAAGGGISNTGTLNVTNSTFIGNGAAVNPETGSGGGGGIVNSGTSTVTTSTFTSNNSDGGGGGGILNEGTLTVINSTFTANTATYIGGGIANGGGTLTVTNSTFTANSASSGGGILNCGTLTVTNSTLTGNSAEGGYLGGGGIANSNCGPAVLRNTIVAHSVAGGNCEGVTDGGHNLDDGTSCGFNAANGSLSNTDPQLDPAGLQDNGGPTQTMALCTGPDEPAGCRGASPANHAGDPAVCAAAPVSHLDQRGLYRPDGCPNCSIGAYEPGAVTPICQGDCDGNRRVTVDELIEGVNIALGVAPLLDCLPFFCQSDPNVLVACVVQAVNAALDDVCIARPPPQFEGGPGCK